MGEILYYLKRNLLVVLTVLSIISLSMVTVAFASDIKILYYDEYWLTPFESVTKTVYDLGDEVTSTVTTTTSINIISVRHDDEKLFSKEQWDEILTEIKNGNITWED